MIFSEMCLAMIGDKITIRIIAKDVTDKLNSTVAREYAENSSIMAGILPEMARADVRMKDSDKTPIISK